MPRLFLKPSSLGLCEKLFEQHCPGWCAGELGKGPSTKAGKLMEINTEISMLHDLTDIFR